MNFLIIKPQIVSNKFILYKINYINMEPRKLQNYEAFDYGEYEKLKKLFLA